MDILILLVALSTNTVKAEECWWMGAFVETAEQTADMARKERQWVAWISLAPDDRRRAVVIRARAAHKAGVTSQEIYRECASI